MRKIKVEKYLFTAREKETMDAYIRFLASNPLPCTNCPAQKSGKCQGYTIFSLSCDVDERCSPVQDWFAKYRGDELRQNMRLLKDETVKQMIVNRYLFELAKNEQDKTNAKVMLAERKVKEDEEISGQDFNVHCGGSLEDAFLLYVDTPQTISQNCLSKNETNSELTEDPNFPGVYM